MMDIGQIAGAVASVLAVLFGSAGIAAFYQAKKVADVGEAEVEVKARSAATADWEAVKTYWEKEIGTLRTQVNGLQTKIETMQARHTLERESDRIYISDLESHIWLQKPAPPPVRRPVLGME